MIFEKQFLVFVEDNDERSIRQKDILDRLGISDRLYICSETMLDVLPDIDYTKVNIKLEKYRGMSMDFLKGIVSQDAVKNT